jgi:hypothetical protein
VPRRGSREKRNAGHKARQAELYAAAQADDVEALRAAFDWFRSSAALLARRRPPRPFGKDAHRPVAASVMREMAAELASAARAIDRGDYDLKGAA